MESSLRILRIVVTRPCFSSNEQQRNVVGGGDVVDCNYLVGLDCTRHGNFVNGAFLERDITAACNLSALA